VSNDDHLFDQVLLILILLTSADLIRSISDPEHPNMSLEQLMVVSAPQVAVMGNHVAVEFTPTVPHCGASTLIGMPNIQLVCAGNQRCSGLSIRVRLLRSLPQRYKIDIRVKPGSHQSEHAGVFHLPYSLRLPTSSFPSQQAAER
jgi:hypothetical protein